MNSTFASGFTRPMVSTPAPQPCPVCRSPRVRSRNVAKRIGSVSGACVGGLRGLALALSGAEAGAITGSCAGPVGAAIGGLSGAILGALAGALSGGSVGAMLGKAIDDRLLDNHQCLECSHVF